MRKMDMFPEFEAALLTVVILCGLALGWAV